MLWPGYVNHRKTSKRRGTILSGYCSFAYSALACFRMEMSGSASFQSVRKCCRRRAPGHLLDEILMLVNSKTDRPLVRYPPRIAIHVYLHRLYSQTPES